MELTFPGGTAMALLSFAAVFVLQFTSLSGLSDDGCEDRLLSWSGHTFHVRRCPYTAPGGESLAGVSDSQQVTRVPITVRLLGDFIDDLKNDSSTTYINFTEEFNKAVTSMFKDVQSFVGVEIQHYSAGSIVVEFDIIIQEEVVDVDDVIDVVSVIASALASSNSTLGNFTVGEVSFVADDNTTSAVTPCDCGELNCVKVLGDCVAFCSSNINYCFNGGTCRSNRSTALVCDCLVTQDVFYTGDRCEDEVVITRSPPMTRADTKSPTDPAGDWTVFVTTVDMTTAYQDPKTDPSAKTTVSSTRARGMNSSTVLPTTSTTVLRDSTVVPTTSTAAANVSVPSPTPSPKSGPVPPSECTFPFEYDNKMYHECTTTDSSRPWCAWDSVFRYSRWGYCEVQEPKEPECSFPFVYHGNYYFSCTTENSYGKPWCAYDTMYQEQSWRHCDGSGEVEKPEKPEDTQCAFPFVYKGNIYYSCTTEDSLVPWCATDRLYQPDRWVLCSTKTADLEQTDDEVLPDKRCQLQFWYKDEMFTGCTDQDSLYPWCAWDVTYQKGRWSVCHGMTGKDTGGSGDLSGSGSGDEDGSAVSPKDENEDAWLWDDTSCHIPFVYKGKTYSGCTMKDSPIPWCSVDPVFQPGRWAFCKDEQSKPRPPREDDKPSDSTEVSDSQCVFPFYYKGVLYTGCAMADSLTPWCAWDRVYRKNRWSYCEKALPEPSSVEGKPYDCVFPFHYGGHWNYDCIVSESGRPWCPWDQSYRAGRYSFCDTDKKNKKSPPEEGSGGSDLSGSGEEIACTFPFYYNGVLYKRCTLVDSLVPWCAWDKTFQEGRWSECKSTQHQDNYSGDDTSGSGSGEDVENILCTFPFVYRQRQYAECTMADSLRPWCAWDKIYEPGRFSFCDTDKNEGSAEGSGTPDPGSGEETSDSSAEMSCTFPFKYKGELHIECTHIDSVVPWCAWDAEFQPGRWSVCAGPGDHGWLWGEESGDDMSGSGDDTPCVFPFRYQGIWYSDCTLVDSLVPWCSWDQHYEEGRYTICTEGSKTTNAHPTETSGDSEASGSGGDGKCSFPFMYNDVLYTGCTKVDSIVPWCAWDQHYREGRYSICKEAAKDSMPDGKDEKDCVFPFTYGGEVYDSCTTQDSVMPWCAWDAEYQFGRWSYCKYPVKPTSPPPVVPADCVFPFYYKGQRFDECTAVGYILPWCAWDQAYTEGRWSICEGKPSEEHTRPSDEHCVFPFVYGGLVFTQCTSVDSSRPWCSWERLHTAGRWSYCECTFPFQYQGRTYHRCTTDDWHEPWCALDSQYLPHRWMACTEKITTTTKPSKTTTSHPKKTTTPEVLITTEVVTSAPRTDAEFVTDFFTPNVATEVVDFTTPSKKMDEMKTEFSTQETVQDTTMNMAQTTVTELLPDVTEQVTMATEEANTKRVATSMGTDETTTSSVQNSTQVLQETTAESLFLTTAVMEVETLEETSDVTTISETTSKGTQTDMPLVTTDTVEESSASSGQTAALPTTVQVLTSSEVPVSTSVVVPKATSDMVVTTTEVPPSTFVVVDGSTSTAQATTSAAVQETTTSAVSPDATTVVEATTSSSVTQKTTTVAVQGTPSSLSQTTSSVAAQGTTTSVVQTSSVAAQGTTTSSSVEGQETTISVGQTTSSATVPVQDITASTSQTTSSVAAQDTTISVGQTTSSAAVPVQDITASTSQTTSSVAAQDTTISVGQTTSSAAVPVQDTTASVSQATSSVAVQDTTVSVGQMTSSVAVQGTTASVSQTTSSVAVQGTTASVSQTTSSVAVQGTTAAVSQTTSSVAVQGTTAAVGQTSSVAVQGTTASVSQTTSSVAVQGTTASVSQTTSPIAVQGTTTSFVAQETTSAVPQGTTTTLGAVQETTSSITQKLTTVSQGTSTAEKSTTTTSVVQPTTSRQVTTTFGVVQGTTSSTLTLTSSTQKPTTESSTIQKLTSSTQKPTTQSSTTNRLTTPTQKPTTQSSTTQRLTTLTLPVTTVVTSAVAIEVQITSQNFTQELTNSTTTEYQQLAQELIDYLSQLYADVPGFQGIVINGFREGSIIAEFDVIIATSQVAVSPQEIGSVLQTAVENTDNTLGNFVVGRLSLAVEGNFTEMSTCSNREGCGNGVKCTKIGDKCMAFCRTNAGYCYNGGQCSDSANDHLTCLCPWNLWRYYSGDRCQNVATSIILYIIIGSCAGGLLIILAASSWIAIMVKRSRNKSFAHSVGNTPDPGREGSIRGYGYSKDPFMRSLAEMLEQNAQDGNQVWNKQVGHTNRSFLYQPEDQRTESEEDRIAEENQRDLLSKMRIYDAQVHDGMQTVSSTAGSRDITIHFPARSSRPRDNTTFAPLHTYNPRFLKDVHL